MRLTKILLLVALGATLIDPSYALACPSCYGAADSPMVDGMNMAILAMLGITGCVLAAISSFFIIMRRRLKQLRGSLAAHASVNEQGVLRWNNS